jgi:hypothetical protein
MKMKFNWGHGIFIGIACCVTALLILVFNSTKETIDLVVEDYYPKELKFENDIEKIKNTKSLEKNISFSVRDSIYVQFPDIDSNKLAFEGEIWFYRPSDKSLDIKSEIMLNDSLYMSFPLTKFSAGKYEIIVDWSCNDTEFLTKEILVF